MVPAWSLPVPARDPGSIRASARQIVARAEFRPLRRSLPSAAWHWLSQRLGRWLGHLFGGGGTFVSYWIVAAMIAAVAIALASWAFWRARGVPGRRRPRPASGVVVSHTGQRRSSEAWLAEAAALEDDGAWREGIRARYRALLAALADMGITEEWPGRTSGEYRRQVSARLPAAATAMGLATDLFESCWYGDISSGPDERDRLMVLSAEILAAADREPRGSSAGPQASSRQPAPVGGTASG